MDVILQMLTGKLVEGYMPIQMLGEMGGFALLFIGTFHYLGKAGIKVNKLAQATGFIVGFLGYNSMAPSIDEPIELRTVHPAPPASTKVHGKTFVLQTASSPYRVDDEGKYSDVVQKKYADGNPWDEKAPPYLQYVREGGQIFFQNCHFCHGDNLNGRGMFAFAFNPIPANFTDAGTIAQLQETFVFWRVSKGGIGLPREGFPWASVMPPWEQHLTTDEIWKVILFEYWHTGYYPRTWD